MAKEIKFNIKLAIDGKEQLVSATSSVRELRNAVSTAGAGFSSASSVIQSFNQQVSRLQNINSSVGQLVSTLNSVTEESRTFGAAMNAANTMAGKSGEDFAKLKGEVAELSKTVPVARDELANGLYQVISNGVPEGNWIEFLEKSAKASVGGIADLGETVKVTSTVIKNYGLSWEDAAGIQDKIQLTAKNGVTSFEQLAQALPRVTGNAATLGVSIDELMATFATLTGVSGNTNEVATQMAAVFTALVKPSSQATQMAQKMGIEFNAASIKAAGGMQNFLTQLDASVKKYAQANGILEQEVYAKLFGSAESLRAIGPLTGQLASTFEKNVAAMNGSAGTIDDAFTTMSSSGAASLQMLKNKLGEVTDTLTQAVGPALPILNFGSQLGMSAMSVVTLSKAFSGLGASLGVTKVAAVAMNGAGTVWNATSVRMNALAQTLGASMKGAAVSTATFKMAVQGLMIATGIGAAVVALTTATQAFGSASDDAADDANGLGDALKSAHDTYESTLKNTLSDLMTKYDQLKTGWATLKTEQEKIDWISKQQGAFETLGMKVDSVADAEALFGKNTEGVVQAFERRAQAAAYAAKLTELYQKQLEAKEKSAGADKEAKAAEAEYKKYVGTTAAAHPNIGVLGGNQRVGSQTLLLSDARQAKKAADEAKAAVAAVNKEIAETLQGMKALGNTGAKITTSDGGGGGPKGPRSTGGAGGVEKALEGSIDWYEKQIRDLQKQLNATADEEAAKTLQQTIEGKQKELDELKVRIGIEKPDEAEVQTEVKSAMEVLQEQLRDAETAFDNAVTVEAKVAAAAKVAEIQSQIDEATNGQLTIKADVEPTYIEKGSMADKRQSYSNAQSKANRIQQDYEIGLIGKEDAEKQLDDLNKDIAQLGDNIKPFKLEVEADTSKAIDGLSALQRGWSSISGIGNGIQQMTSAIEGNGNAWETISGLVNGFLSVAQGIQGIVTLVNTLSAATQMGTAATVASTAAKSADAAADTASVATQTATIAATVGAIAANKLVTASYLELASAEYFAAHASIPFVGAGIAAGFVAQAVATTLAVGLSAFATGGVVGGTSTHGDKKFARVNSGEMILNKFQQTTLWNLIDGGYRAPEIYERAMPQVVIDGSGMAEKVEPAQTVVNVEMAANVRRLFNVMMNEERVRRKSGLS